MGEDPVARDDGGAQRLFLAVEVPRSVGQVVAEAIQPWREAFPDARWVPSADWHVTLRFLGRTRLGLLPWIEEKVRGVAATHAPTTIRVEGIGAFPSVRRARVLWAGIDPPDGLAALVADLGTELSAEFRAEIRRFHPHLTVARSEPPLHLPSSYADTPLSSDAFVADRVVLLRSHLRGRSQKYESISTFALGG
jgi:RNA 2',3'-cyclic 3'-phosphodiesterase